MLIICSCFTLFIGCECNHEWSEATCKSLATCSKCGETTGEFADHKWSEATCTAPETCSICGLTQGKLINHSGRDTCSVCNTNLINIWKYFIDKNSESDKFVIGGSTSITVVATYNNDFDCHLFAMGYGSDDLLVEERTFSLGYNSYDKKWTWIFEGSFNLNIPNWEYEPTTGRAMGSFSEWSSRSNTLPCSYKTGDYFNTCDDSTLLGYIKQLYNKILDVINTKLSECGYNITLANLGLLN